MTASVPLCPILLHGSAMAGLSDLDACECLGSECAMWWPDPNHEEDERRENLGRCGLTNAARSFPDPAKHTEPK
jgi:hypothetical protein